MSEFMWRIIARIISYKPVANYIINRAKKTPYYHLAGYMNRWWLFNRYSEVGKMDKIKPRFSWLPSIRVHQILRPDVADHPHDHPWDGRTIILRGGYAERREDGRLYLMVAGDTRAIKFGEYHHISYISPMVYTLFITYKYRGTWGFLVDGKKIPWREYERSYPPRVLT